MLQRSFAVAVVGAALCFVLAESASAMSTRAHGSAVTRDGYFGFVLDAGAYDDFDLTGLDSSGGASVIGTSFAEVSRGQISSFAAIGVLGALATAASFSGRDIFGAITDAQANAAWGDVLTVTLPAGGSGVVTAALGITGSVAAVAPDATSSYARAIADWDFSFCIEANCIQRIGGQESEILGVPESLGSPPGVFFVTIPFESGHPIAIGGTLIVTAHATALGNNGFADAGARFSNGVSWLGFQTVVDSLGQPIPEYLAIAESGVDYTQAVPEPSTPAALALALAALAARRATRSA